MTKVRGPLRATVFCRSIVVIALGTRVGVSEVARRHTPLVLFGMAGLLRTNWGEIISRVIHRVHGYLWSLFVFFHLIYFASLLSWIVLGALVQPDEYITMGTTILVPIVTAIAIYNRMKSVADALKAKLRKQFEASLQQKLKEAMARIENQDITVKNIAAGRPADSPYGRKRPEDFENVKPIDIFLAVNTDGDPVRTNTATRHNMPTPPTPSVHRIGGAGGHARGSVRAHIL